MLILSKNTVWLLEVRFKEMVIILIIHLPEFITKCLGTLVHHVTGISLKSEADKQSCPKQTELYLRMFCFLNMLDLMSLSLCRV